MLLKLSPTAVLVAALLLLSTTGAVAQVVQVQGKVTLKQADGTVVPVQGAVVDIYRTDIKQEFHVRTDARGAYTHRGLPMMGTYTVAVSAPGARPDYRAGIRLGREPVNDFTLEPGDGSRLTLDQIKPGAARPTPAAESAADRARREELERKVKEVEEANARIDAANQIVSRTFQAGNAALNAGRLDEAITQYREGLAARADEPALLTNLSEALRRRGAEVYNAALKEKDGNQRYAAMEPAKKDWSEAAQASRKALDIINSARAVDPAQQQAYAQNKLAALSTYALAMRLVATKVDQSQASAAWEASQAHLAVENDPARKAKLRSDALQMLFDSGSMDLAVAEARKVLAVAPDDPSANRILGLSLFASGDKKNFQEAANYLQRYVEKAPDTDPLKQSAKESLDYLKTAENIEPQRPARSRRSPN